GQAATNQGNPGQRFSLSSGSIRRTRCPASSPRMIVPCADRAVVSVYAEAVTHPSPGPRTPPWVIARPALTYPEGVTQRGVVVQPRRGRKKRLFFASQGALRDPGVWCVTPSA